MFGTEYGVASSLLGVTPEAPFPEEERQGWESFKGLRQGHIANKWQSCAT